MAISIVRMASRIWARPPQSYSRSDWPSKICCAIRRKAIEPETGRVKQRGSGGYSCEIDAPIM